MLMPKDGDVPGVIIASSLVFYDNGLYLTGYQWPSEADSINDQSLYVYDLERKLWKILYIFASFLTPFQLLLHSNKTVLRPV